MSQKIVGQGPGNLAPDQEIKQFLAGEAIAIGQVLTIIDADTTGYTVGLADSDDTNDLVIGVAAAAIASGAWGPVIVSGWIPYLVTDGNVTAGCGLCLTATAGSAGIATIGTHDIFGQALEMDSGTVCTKALMFKRL